MPLGCYKFYSRLYKNRGKKNSHPKVAIFINKNRSYCFTKRAAADCSFPSEDNNLTV